MGFVVQGVERRFRVSRFQGVERRVQILGFGAQGMGFTLNQA